MIRAKLFESKKIGSKFMTAAEQVEDFILVPMICNSFVDLFCYFKR